MTNLKNIALAGALALGAATSAQAVTFTPNVNDRFTFTFEWEDKVGNTPIASEETGSFGIGFDFNLSIDSVTGNNALVGYFIDGPTGRLTNSTTCSGASGVENCDLVFSSEPDGKLLFSDLDAGEYNFGIFGDTVFSEGSLTFEVIKVAAVPLPAGGALLLGAMGAFGLARRRKG